VHDVRRDQREDAPFVPVKKPQHRGFLLGELVPGDRADDARVEIPARVILVSR
jgi:hypothetical protein